MQIHLACVCVFVCVRGVRAGVRACGRAGVRACGRAGVRACGRACACVFGCVGVVVHFCEGECGGFLRGPQSVSDVSHHGGGSGRDRSHSFAPACVEEREIVRDTWPVQTGRAATAASRCVSLRAPSLQLPRSRALRLCVEWTARLATASCASHLCVSGHVLMRPWGRCGIPTDLRADKGVARPTKRDAGVARITRPVRPSPPSLAPAPLRPSRQPCKHAPSACARSFSKSG